MRKMTATFTALLAVLALPTTGRPSYASDATRPGGVMPARLTPAPDVDGYYKIYGRASKGFENIDHLTLFLNARKGERLPASGVYARGGVVFKIVAPKVEARRLSFNTAPVRGVSYSFEGRFLRDDPAEAGDEAVLEGSMSKFVGGRRVARADVRFSYFSGD